MSYRYILYDIIYNNHYVQHLLPSTAGVLFKQYNIESDYGCGRFINMFDLVMLCNEEKQT